ncbi:MAG TPA: efflux RND transporter periplasmic adaptor subunit [Vicinamibacterales bacterium]|nr:efflux RND transporter periplasmic adaptor subunit [Vicinamibacterales bacterium]
MYNSAIQLSGLALTAALAASLAACSRAQTAQASKRDGDPKPVSITVVHKNSVARAVDVVGTLAAVDQVTVSSEADGKVQKINADLGDRVRAGQVLIELDDEKQRYAYEQQQAALARTLAQYGAPDPEHLPDIEQTPEAKRTKADLAQAEQAYERAAELFKRTLIPQQGLDDARTAVETKKASYDASLHNARNLRASIRASEAEMKLAARRLRDAAIRAPFDGYVEKRLVNLGELVKAQMPVMAIVRLDPLKVIAEIPEKMAPWIAEGRPVELRVDAYRDRTFTGKVTRISPAVNTSTRAFPFEAVVPNADAVLKPGTFARVHVESGKVDDVLTLPYAALQYRYGVNRVFVVQGDRLAVRELQVGERVGDRIEIVSGVKAGEQVAITDVESLADGALVSVTK